MNCLFQRRGFLQLSLSAGSLILANAFLSRSAQGLNKKLISPGCRKSKVKIAKVYLYNQTGLWPTPTLNAKAEVEKYEKEFQRLSKDFQDVEFTTSELITSPDQIATIGNAIREADGILAIKFSIGTFGYLQKLLAFEKPTMLFAEPYSGHEWTRYGALRQQEEGRMFDCLLTTDYGRLANAIRPIRAIHHLREAKVLNVTTRDHSGFTQSMKEKFGTKIVQTGREEVLNAYKAIPENHAKQEAKRWIQNAQKVVEPTRDEIVKSCRLALAFEKMLDDQDATVLTADCYGAMYHKLPAYPCIGFTRLNDMGLGGICESDLQCAMTHILFQGLSGKPGFISDPTMDTSCKAAILAHCLGTTKMDGPDGPAAPYNLRTIMERQEGAVPQVIMRIGEKVTQAKLLDQNQLLYFTGDIIDVPESERGCRTKITVRVDGNAEALWKNWSHGLHRVTCYGDITDDLARFCKFKNIDFVKEA